MTTDNIVTALHEIIDEYNKYRRLVAIAYAKQSFITKYEEETDESLEEIRVLNKEMESYIKIIEGLNYTIKKLAEITDTYIKVDRVDSILELEYVDNRKIKLPIKYRQLYIVE